MRQQQRHHARHHGWFALEKRIAGSQPWPVGRKHQSEISEEIGFASCRWACERLAETCRGCSPIEAPVASCWLGCTTRAEKLKLVSYTALAVSLALLYASVNVYPTLIARA